MTVVYLDAFLVLNFVVNYLLLACAGKLDGEPVGRGRTALAAALGEMCIRDRTMTGTIIATGITAVTLGGTMTVDTMTGTAIRTDTAPGAAGIGMMTLTARTGSAQPPTGRTMAPPGRNGPPAAAPEAVSYTHLVPFSVMV